MSSMSGDASQSSNDFSVLPSSNGSREPSVKTTSLPSMPETEAGYAATRRAAIAAICTSVSAAVRFAPAQRNSNAASIARRAREFGMFGGSLYVVARPVKLTGK